MKKFILLLILISQNLSADEQTARDKLVENAQRVEKGVLKDLGSLRDKGCRLLKNKKCVQDKKEEKKEEKSN